MIFAKAPRPGTVKTRLIPLLGEDGAAQLQARLIERTLETARAVGRCPIELCCAPDADDPFLRSSASRFGAAITAQAQGDLGTRMLAAFKNALASHERALLIGSDCPALTAGYLHQAGQMLEDADAVFGPCEDGGYALIGLKRTSARLFDNVNWGSSSVMLETRSRLLELGWRWRELEILWDIDRPADYQRLMTSGLFSELTFADPFPHNN